MHIKFLASVLICCLLLISGSVWGTLPTKYESFDDDRGWLEWNNTTGLNKTKAYYRWLGTNHCGAGAGEIGGVVHRTAYADYYVDDLGGSLTLDDAFSASGLFICQEFDRDGFPRIGHQARGDGGQFLGLEFWDYGRIGVYCNTQSVNLTRVDNGQAHDIWDEAFVYRWDYTYDPAGNGVLTVNWRDESGTVIATGQMPLDGATRSAGGSYDSFGMSSRPFGSGDEQFQTVYFDELQYTVKTLSKGITIIPTDYATEVTEGGAGDTYSIVLTVAPTSSVYVVVEPEANLRINGGSAGALAVLTFSTSNWNVPKIVTVEAIDNAAIQGDYVSSILHRSGSSDAAYDAIDIRDLPVTVVDDDSGVMGSNYVPPPQSADQTVNDDMTLALWHMDHAVSVRDACGEYRRAIDDDDSAHGRNHDLILGERLATCGAVDIATLPTLVFDLDGRDDSGHWALDFDGVDDLAYNAGLWSRPDEFCVTFEIVPFDLDSDQTVLELPGVWQITLDAASDSLILTLEDTAGTRTATSPSLAAGQWQSVDVLAANGSLSINVNGQSGGGGVYNGTLANETDNVVLVGCSSGGADYFNGLLDEVHISELPQSTPDIFDAAHVTPYGNAGRIVFNPDGTLTFNPDGSSNSNKKLAIVSNDDFDYGSFQIDALIDPVVDLEGHDKLAAGITFGLTSATSDPMPYSNNTTKVSWVLREQNSLPESETEIFLERRGKWDTRLFGGNISLHSDLPGGDSYVTQNHYEFLQHTGVYHMRITGYPHAGGTMLRFYLDDMMRPVEERLLPAPITLGHVAVFSYYSASSGSGSSTVEDFSVQQITGQDAARKYASDEYVMYSLDLDYPGLESVKSAMDAGDFEIAKALFIDHMRTRSAPLGRDLDPGYYNSNYMEIADNALQGRYALTGWYADFSDGFTNPDGTVNWSIDRSGFLNRHYHWSALAKAYLDTGNEAYAERFAFEVSDWVMRLPHTWQNSVIGIDMVEDTRVHLGWLNSGNLGRRMEVSWWPPFEVFRSTESFTDQAMFHFLDVIIANSWGMSNPTHFLVRDDSGFHSAVGLFHNAVLFPECSMSSRWKEIADRRVQDCIDIQVYQDGTHISLSTGYGFVFYDAMANYIRLLEKQGQAPPQDQMDRLELAYTWPMALSRPNRGLVSLNDGTYDTVSPAPYLDAVEFFPARQDFLWFATSEAEGQPPAFDSIYLDNSGWEIFRTGWGPQEKWLFMDAGPFGASHGKEDKLGIFLDYGGNLLLSNGGRASYDASEGEWAGYANSSRATNTISVDEGVQHRIDETPVEIYGYTPEERRWVSQSGIQYGEGFHTDGWRQTMSPNADIKGVWTRQILQIDGDNPPATTYYIVFDNIVPADGGTHDYKMWFHSRRNYAQIDTPASDCIVSIWDSGASCKIIPLALNEGLGVSLVRGQETPYKQGWFVWGYAKGAINTPEYAWTATGETTKAWLLVPASGAQDYCISSVTRETATADTIQVTINRTDGGSDTVIRRPVGAPAIQLEGVYIEGDVAVVKKNAAGQIQATFDIARTGYDLSDLGLLAEQWLMPSCYTETAGSACLEAEWYSSAQPGSAAAAGYAWQQTTDPTAYGSGLVQALPDQLFAITSDVANASPHLSYEIDFQNPGTYYIWLKGRAASVARDSLYFGLDGTHLDPTEYMKLNTGSTFTWRCETNKGKPSITITTPGLHQFDIWMREAGAEIDRVFLTTDPFFNPTYAEPPLGPQPGMLTMDLNGDGAVDLHDLPSFSGEWNP